MSKAKRYGDIRKGIELARTYILARELRSAWAMVSTHQVASSYNRRTYEAYQVTLSRWQAKNIRKNY